MMKFPPVYPITDKRLARKDNHCCILKELIRGGATLVQIRDKSTPTNELFGDLIHCVEYSIRRGTTLILNDRCDIVLSCGASGVHLGQDDLDPRVAQTILDSNHIIGYSTHSISQVRTASLLPVQYIGFGPVFETSTKENAEPAAGVELLREACRQSKVPVVAIGGITLGNIDRVLAAGAASAAVISSIMVSEDIAGTMDAFMERATGR
ncbi:MAG: thiamine phosphate synthase [Acidobacteriota bacterium]